MEIIKDQRGIIGEVILVLFAIGVVVYVFGRVYAVKHSAVGITDFASCVKAGYPVQTSYPAVCRAPDGRSFNQY